MRQYNCIYNSNTSSNIMYHTLNFSNSGSHKNLNFRLQRERERERERERARATNIYKTHLSLAYESSYIGLKYKGVHYVKTASFD